MVNLIRQQHPKGCVVASLAMIIGVSYDAASRLLPGYVANGVQTLAIIKVLRKKGWQTELRHGAAKPWASIHLAVVGGAKAVLDPLETRHMIVVLPTGEILDPAEGRIALGLSTYHKVFYTIGLTPPPPKDDATD